MYVAVNDTVAVGVVINFVIVAAPVVNVAVDANVDSIIDVGVIIIVATNSIIIGYFVDDFTFIVNGR